MARGRRTAARPCSTLFDGLTQILKDPNQQMKMTPDRTAIVFMSPKGEVS